MDLLIEGLTTMVFELKVVTIADNPKAVLVFSLGCAIVGLFAILLDGSLYLLRGRSLLKLNHGKYTLLFVLAWSFGAFVMGWLGQLANIFLVSLPACVLVGFSWPIVFTKLLEKVREDENKDEPEQKEQEEN